MEEKLLSREIVSYSHHQRGHDFSEVDVIWVISGYAMKGFASRGFCTHDWVFLWTRVCMNVYID